MATEPVDRYAWLDEVIRKIAFVYQDDFTLVPAGRTEEYHPKHGSCQRFTYRFVFAEGAYQALPNEEGMRLMKLIKQAAVLAKAEPTLVSTRTKGRHDYADWGWSTEGAEMWIFLKPEK